MKYLLYIFIIGVIISCDKDDIISNEKSKLVVEGWIANEEYPIVMLSTTIPVSTQKQYYDTLEQHVRRYAKVTVNDGEKEVVLTGIYNDKYMPPYIYTTTDMKGAVGHTYYLTASVDSFYATAHTIIPQPVKIDTLIERVVSDSTVMLSIDFQDPDTINYYCLFYKLGSETQQFNLCNLGVFNDQSIGANVSYPVYQSSNISNKFENTKDVFNIGDTICVQLSNIDKLMYDFWNDFQNTAALSNNFIMPYAQNSRTNIVGGYGYWCGYGVSRKWRIIGESK